MYYYTAHNPHYVLLHCSQQILTYFIHNTHTIQYIENLLISLSFNKVFALTYCFHIPHSSSLCMHTTLGCFCMHDYQL